MDTRNYSGVLNANISKLRRAAGLTQEQLADRLGLTFQAVSKWENGLSCPDIALLPMLADVFAVSIDVLFNRQPNTDLAEILKAKPTDRTPNGSGCPLPWTDDGVLRAVLFIGNRLVTEHDAREKEIRFVYEGEALNVDSRFSIECGDVGGNVNAGGGVDCGDVESSVSAGGGVECGDVNGCVNAGGGVECGDVDGCVNAGGGVDCGDIDGCVNAGGGVNCDEISGNVTAGSAVNAGDIGGDLSTGGKVSCGDVGGDLKSEGDVDCGNVSGNIAVKGNLSCGDIAGYVRYEGIIHCGQCACLSETK